MLALSLIPLVDGIKPARLRANYYKAIAEICTYDEAVYMLALSLIPLVDGIKSARLRANYYKTIAEICTYDEAAYQSCLRGLKADILGDLSQGK